MAGTHDVLVKKSFFSSEVISLGQRKLAFIWASFTLRVRSVVGALFSLACPLPETARYRQAGQRTSTGSVQRSTSGGMETFGSHSLRSGTMHAGIWVRRPRRNGGNAERGALSASMELIGLPSQGEGRKILEKHHSKWHRWEGQVVRIG